MQLSITYPEFEFIVRSKTQLDISLQYGSNSVIAHVNLNSNIPSIGEINIPIMTDISFSVFSESAIQVLCNVNSNPRKIIDTGHMEGRFIIELQDIPPIKSIFNLLALKDIKFNESCIELTLMVR